MSPDAFPKNEYELVAKMLAAFYLKKCNGSFDISQQGKLVLERIIKQFFCYIEDEFEFKINKTMDDFISSLLKIVIHHDGEISLKYIFDGYYVNDKLKALLEPYSRYFLTTNYLFQSRYPYNKPKMPDFIPFDIFFYCDILKMIKLKQQKI